MTLTVRVFRPELTRFPVFMFVHGDIHTVMITLVGSIRYQTYANRFNVQEGTQGYKVCRAPFFPHQERFTYILTACRYIGGVVSLIGIANVISGDYPN